MKKTIAIMLTLIFVFAVTSVTFAAEEKKAAPAAKAEEKKETKAAKAKQVTGEVGAVDAKAKTVTVKGKAGDVTIAADDKTKFSPEGKSLADVKAGDKVTVKYTEADGKNTAKNIEIKAAPAKKEEKPKAEKAAPAAAPKAEEKKAAPAAAAPAAPKAEEKKPAAPAPAPKKSSSGY